MMSKAKMWVSSWVISRYNRSGSSSTRMTTRFRLGSEKEITSPRAIAPGPLPRGDDGLLREVVARLEENQRDPERNVVLQFELIR